MTPGDITGQGLPAEHNIHPTAAAGRSPLDPSGREIHQHSILHREKNSKNPDNNNERRSDWEIHRERDRQVAHNAVHEQVIRGGGHAREADRLHHSSGAAESERDVLRPGNYGGEREDANGQHTAFD